MVSHLNLVFIAVLPQIPCPSYPVLPYQLMFGVEYKSHSSSLCSECHIMDICSLQNFLRQLVQQIAGVSVGNTEKNRKQKRWGKLKSVHSLYKVIFISIRDAKKMCKKLKVSPEPFMLKHYKDGDFHKDYDRLETLQSMVNFMRDPSGDIPWEEDSMAVDVVHISDALVSL